MLCVDVGGEEDVVDGRRESGVESRSSSISIG